MLLFKAQIVLMEKFVWLMVKQHLKEGLKYVLIKYGALCVVPVHPISGPFTNGQIRTAMSCVDN